MLILLILLALAYAQDSYGANQPAYVWALVFAIINFIFGVMGGHLFASFVSAVILGLYAWGYFVVLRRFSDNTLLWLVICVLGLILPVLLTMTLITSVLYSVG